MQNSSEFQYLPTDQIFVSSTNPRKSFDPAKLEELAESIRQHGVIQPVVVRPKEGRYELVAGERRFRGSLIADKFAIPAHIKELTDAQAIEWQLVENSQRVDVHPYEEAQGFQNLLNMPGYDVAALAAKSGKSVSHIYARLSLLQLIPGVAEAFVAERITASHANLIARLPQEQQAAAFEICWRKDWQDAEPHLLPAKHLTTWIETNLYLGLQDAPFDREDVTLVEEAGACINCPKRSGHNTSLFPDVAEDQCLDGVCYQTKVSAHIDHTLANNPQLVQIATSWRHAKEQRPGVLAKQQYRVLDIPDNPDADPPCASTKSALIVFGKQAGKTVTICLDDECPVHDLETAARIAKEEAEHPAPIMEPPAEEENEEAARDREAENQRRREEYQAEEERRTAERKEEAERQQREYEQETQRRVEEHNGRLATLERIVNSVSAVLDPVQLRFAVELLLDLSPYGLFEEVAEHFADGDDNNGKTDDEILQEALAACADDRLFGFVFRLLLTTHVGLPRGEETDWLLKAESLFAAHPKARKKSAKKQPRTKAKPLTGTTTNRKKAA